VVPVRLAEEVAAAAAPMEEKERFIMEKIHAGASIIGMYPMDEKAEAEFDNWRGAASTG